MRTVSTRFALTCFALFAGILPINAEDWHKLRTDPYTLNNKQDALAFADARVGWYGNGTGRVYKTIDSGEHWTQVWRHRGTYVRALEFVDERTGFLGNVGPGYFPDVGDLQPFYRTQDGGITWSAVRYTGPRVVGICAIDVLKLDGKTFIHAGGRVGGPAGMLESHDGGITWRSIDLGFATGMILDIKFLDAKIGFIAGASDSNESRAHARLLKTTDGGENWRPVFESTRAGDVNWKLAFPSIQVGYATIISYDAPQKEARGYVVKTEDGGEHWKPLLVSSDPEWIPYGISFLDDNHGFVGGSTGGYETKDGGKTWSRVSFGNSVNKIRFTVSGGRRWGFAIGQSLYRGDLN